MSFKQIYESQGYVIVPNLISPIQFDQLRSACDRIIDRTRRGQWQHRRTLGKQFPPYGDANPDSWGVQHIMHPALGERAFVEWYTSDGVVNVAKELLACEEDDLQMELFNLLINPLHNDFALRWHRDDIGEGVEEEEEKLLLKQWHFGVQWNTALYQDRCLYLVPGSHIFPRTPDQRIFSGQVLDEPLKMPGSIQLTLQPGETVFYNSNILHCAAYRSTEKRATLHGCMGNAAGGSVRARNILQHGLEWMTSDEFRKVLPTARAVKMLDRLVTMQKSNEGGHVGFSLEN